MSDDPKTADLLETVDRERAAGRLWRARDKLRHRLSEGTFDRVLFKAYADVLADMNDNDEAGRCYFLSGERSGRANELVRAFLERRQHRKLIDFWSDMPKAGRRIGDEGIPPVCVKELEGIGHTPDDVRDLIAKLVNREKTRMITARKPRAKATKPDIRARAITFLVMSCLALFLFATVIGFVQIAKFVASTLGFSASCSAPRC